MSKPEQTQSNPPAGGDQKSTGLFALPTAQTSAPEPTPEPEPELKFAATEDGSPDGPADTKPMFSTYKSDEAEFEANQGVSFAKMANRNSDAAPPSENLDDKKQVEQQQKPAEQPLKTTGANKTVVNPRDYTGIEEADVPLFRKMANESFDALKPVYLERKQLQTEVAQLRQQVNQNVEAHPSLYTHPEGYKLTKEYDEMSRIVDLSAQAEEHWNLQLARLRRGLGWQDAGVNDQGKIVLGPEQENNEAAEVYVMRKLNAAQRTNLDVGSKLDNYVKNFNKRHQEDTGVIKQIESQYFPDYDKPDHPTASTQKQVMDLIPEAMRSHPLASILCKVAAGNIFMSKQLQQLQANKTVAAAVKADAKAAPPPASAFKTGGGNGSNVSFSAMRHRH